MAILGLVSTESTSAQRWTNIRRRVFYEYPNGAAPLIGILSLMKEEETNDPKFSWWEKRLKEQKTATASTGSSKGPFYINSGGSWTVPDPVTFTAPAETGETATEYRVKVEDTTLFRVGHVFKIEVAAAGSTQTLRGVVTNVVSSTVLQFYVLETVASVDNGATNENVGLEVLVIGNAFPEGVVDLSSEVYYLPVNPENYAQIFRTPFSFTGPELVTPVKFDDTGIYKDKAKQHSIDHMVEVELAFLFGTKKKYVPTGAADPTTGTGLPLYTTGGILWFLKQWEAGSLYENTAATSDSDDNKRIITNASGTINLRSYNTYLERIFRYSNNASNEKLAFCGSGALQTLNEMYMGTSSLVYYPPNGDTFGMEIVAHKTPFGTVYYKSHPLFSRNSTLRFSILFVDVHNLRYRPYSKRDTQLLKNRQPNDADYRKDEWFTHAGLELRMPESFMYLQNVRSYVP